VYSGEDRNRAIELWYKIEARNLGNKLQFILSHCLYPLGTNLLEGVNNRINVIKRMAYGFRDDQYFFLKNRGAFVYTTEEPCFEMMDTIIRKRVARHDFFLEITATLVKYKKERQLMSPVPLTMS